MSDLSRHRPYLIWGGILVALAILLVLALVPTGAWVALDERRSATRTTPDGVAAWARSLARLGVPVAERYQSLTNVPPGGGALVILDALIEPSAAEAHIALEWVRNGGALVYAPSFSALLMDSLGLNREFHGLSEEAAEDTVASHRWTEEGWAGPTLSSFGLAADSVRAVTWEPLTIDGEEGSPTLAWLPEGEGGVLVLADSEELANRSLSASLAAIVATRALVDRLAPSDTLFFSEYHQALEGSGGPFRETLALARDSRPGRAVLHLAVAAALLLLLTARRFGAPWPESEAERRSTLEHVEALAGIYRAADAERTAARHLIRGAARRLGATHNTGPDPEAAILESWRSRPEMAEAAGAALKALRQSPPDLVALERALDTITAHHTISTITR